MAGTFAGKFAFRSTNATGATYYLTSSPQQDGVYPAVLAPALTAKEHVIFYVQPDGSFVAALAVPHPITRVVSLAYFAGQPELGFVKTDQAVANASFIRIDPFGAVPGSWSVLNKNTWTKLYYYPNLPAVLRSSPETRNAISAARRRRGVQSLLLYATNAAPAGSLKTLQAFCVTPGAATLAKTKQGQKADLAYTDLTGLDFTGVDFTGANFTGAILTRTILRGATLTGAYFTDATMENTDVTGATLDGAHMEGLNLSSLVWGAGISAVGTHFEGSALVGCRIGSMDSKIVANFSGAHFEGADLGQADLSNTNLSSAWFYGANLTAAVLNFAHLNQAHLGGSLTERPATLAYALMSNVVLTGANLFGVNFTAASLYGGSTSISGAATIEQADFSNAYLEGISFHGCNLQGARFDGACLVRTKFTGAKLGASTGNTMPASFVGACLPGADFFGATLDGVNFANAAVSFKDVPPLPFFPVQYCDATGPNSLAFPVSATKLDLDTLRPDTVCPNGFTLAANQKRGVTHNDMLTAPGAPVSWNAGSCFYTPLNRREQNMTL
jgi:uncharacterized protein YjbI with pentapeptide repeats